MKDYVEQARNSTPVKLVEINTTCAVRPTQQRGMGGDGSDHGELLRGLLAKSDGLMRRRSRSPWMSLLYQR
ncbi:MAG: hypothetical protein IPP83_12565 [Flavobacteriales bacterium]|nr:hypothetical protein [Flavobacteriales bacterium]